GNLTTGGTGKTPTTQWLVRLIARSGARVGVIIRGYGGEYEHGCALASDGSRTLLTARQAGDEAYLLAQTLPGVPIGVGRDRIRTGRMLYDRFRPDVIVMDDGMQHWRLHRDLNIVLLNACAPFDNGWTVPRGMLREPKRNLRRAGIVLLTNARRATPEAVAAATREIESLAPGVPTFTADLAPVELRSLTAEAPSGLEWLRSRRVVAISAIGNPESFETELLALGAVLARTFRFADHHSLSAEELAAVQRVAIEEGADAIVTTEKDAVKLPATCSVPLIALRVEMQVDRQAELLSALRQSVPAIGEVNGGLGPQTDGDRLL
ncbi:MAG TPA: tetraacyldisaccharide 4'-kinase, partial [Chthonomonadaceae bacterium]|nr:tetraacyldisaccharide 4'-kinase [Chthonomonadaceae bacterium]